MGKKWTKEEDNYLKENWGSLSIKTIATNLNRTVIAIRNRVGKLGLGDPKLNFDGITLNQLSLVLGKSYSQLVYWKKHYGFPIRTKLFANKSVKIVKYEEFWGWAEKHKQMFDFSKIESNILGPEPDWVKEKRKIDTLNTPKKFSPWTRKEENLLKSMLNAHRYTYGEIAQRLGRTETAIKMRILRLGLKSRPVPHDTHNRWTNNEIQTVMNLIDKGYRVDDIALKLGKSSQGLRKKLTSLGFKFVNEVPVRVGKT